MAQAANTMTGMVGEYTDQALVGEIDSLQEALERLGLLLDTLKEEMLSRLRDRGGTEAIIEGFTCVLKPRSPTFDHGILLALREQLPEHEWAKVYTPPSTKPVPEKYNGQQLNSMARRYGGEVALTIEKGRIDQGSTLIVTKHQEEA